MNIDEYKKEAERFMNGLPYMVSPYNKRSWGNSWHSLCSYHGKLKPAIAHWLIKSFTKSGETVLDPLSGVGTIPFEACLQGRIGIGNDLSRLAYVVSKAKLNYCDKEELEDVITDLDNYISSNIKLFEGDLPYSDFGFNKTVPEYFHESTYKEILLAREYFMNKKDYTAAESIVMSSLLHVLHGNRPYALSRNSHPLTPYAPKGDFIYKNVVEHIRNKIDLVYASIEYNNNGQLDLFEHNENEWSQYVQGEMIYGDVFKLHENLDVKVDNIITSPPFVASIRFYTQNWMRLWFAGWEPDDFKVAEKTFIESRQKKSLDIYDEFFSICSDVLNESGKMILHLGKSKNCDMAEELSIIAAPYFNVIFKGDEDVSKIEKHGIKDKGATTHHQFLFLMKK